MENPGMAMDCAATQYLILKVDTFLNIRIVSGEFIFILQMFTLQIVDKSTSYTFKIVN